MNFLDNLLRYPRFFVSSMLGLFLIVLNPFIELINSKKSILLIFLFFISIFVLYVLNEMINPTY
jgi:hypothetical protein